MANQSAKKHEQKIKTPLLVFKGTTYFLTAWFLLFNFYFYINEIVSLWHFILVLIVSFVSHYCCTTITKYWQLQATEAVQYHIDIIGMNLLVSLIDPWSHEIWHIYWLIVAFVLYYIGKWLWEYITPRYQQTQEDPTGKKQRKEKRQKRKYI